MFARRFIPRLVCLLLLIQLPPSPAALAQDRWTTDWGTNLVIVSGDLYKCIAFTPDGKLLIGGIGSPPGKKANESGIVGQIELWEIGAKKPTNTVYHGTHLHALVVSADGKKFASGSWDKKKPSDEKVSTSTVKVWDLKSFREETVLSGPDDLLIALAISPDGKTLAAGFLKGEVRVWDVQTSKERFTVKAHPTNVKCVAFSPDGKTLAVGGGEMFKPSEFKLLDAGTGKEKATEKGFDKDQVSAMAFSPDGKTLAIGGGDIRLYDMAMSKDRASVPSRFFSVNSLAFTADGKLLAAACGVAKFGKVMLIDASLGKVRVELIAGGQMIATAVSSNGKKVAAVATGVVYLWDVEKELATKADKE